MINEQAQHSNTQVKVIHQKHSTGSQKSLENTDVRLMSPNRSIKSLDVEEVACEVTEAENNHKTLTSASSDFTHVSITDDFNYIPVVETVPINSYTSSDEDEVDEFFDANNEFEITVDDIEHNLKREEDITNTEQPLNKEGIIDLDEEEKNDMMVDR